MGICFSILCSALVAAANQSEIRSCADVLALVRQPPNDGLTVRLCGTVTYDKCPTIPVLSLEDATGAILLRCNDNPPLKAGMQVEVRVSVSPEGTLSTGASAVRTTGRGAVPVPAVISGPDFVAGRHACRPVTLTGVLREAFRDELDEKYVYFVLNADGASVPGAFLSSDPEDLVALRARIGQRVRITGLCDALDSGQRYHAGNLMLLKGLESFGTLEGPDYDPFSAPSVSELHRRRAADIAALGRYRADGRVLAVWEGRRFLLRTKSGDCITVETTGGRLPACDDRVTAVGFPASDLFHVILTGAMWRSADIALPPEAPPETLTSEQLYEASGRHQSINALLHGRLVRLSGRATPADDGKSLLVTDEHGSVRVLLGPKAFADVEDGCHVDVTGVCLLDAEQWTPENVFPRARGIVVIARTPNGVVITSRPARWTYAQIAAALCTLLVLVLGSACLNIVLRRLVRRRERELEQQIIARVESDLKLHERTRLAVELHDTVSQNLTGVAMELRAVGRIAATEPSGIPDRLALAQRTLDGCRAELRNCLWDLRHDALEQTDLDAAIRCTLAPHLGKAELTVRFAVPRELFTDKTLHAILCILRELAINAVRHGGARHLRIAGGIDGEILRFSLREDGCGFDPEAAPGIEQGHFGLQGLRERADALGGTFEIRSEPGRGSRAVVSIVLPRKEPS